MPRKPCFFLPNIPVHIVQRGHSHQPVFFEENDYFEISGQGAIRFQQNPYISVRSG
jgi:hypothetical protein